MSNEDNSDACTWPEQNVIEDWLRKHNIKVPYAVSMELKEAVTAIRLAQVKLAEEKKSAS